jgi:hypothetical protein
MFAVIDRATNRNHCVGWIRPPRKILPLMAINIDRPAWFYILVFENIMRFIVDLKCQDAGLDVLLHVKTAFPLSRDFNLAAVNCRTTEC